MGYDSRCYDLAEAFLRDTPDINSIANRNKLAQHIQTTIEDWISYEEGPCENCGEPRGNGFHIGCA